eukprot:snap_masked-scaffold_2-processed-gene-19.21-mRNA-1 protein AED:1.00 eAED:1.00 QI:0/0/0/0/1/1/2/0/1615
MICNYLVWLFLSYICSLQAEDVVANNLVEPDQEKTINQPVDIFHLFDQSNSVEDKIYKIYIDFAQNLTSQLIQRFNVKNSFTDGMTVTTLGFGCYNNNADLDITTFFSDASSTVESIQLGFDTSREQEHMPDLSRTCISHAVEHVTERIESREGRKNIIILYTDAEGGDFGKDEVTSSSIFNDETQEKVKLFAVGVTSSRINKVNKHLIKTRIDIFTEVTNRVLTQIVYRSLQFGIEKAEIFLKFESAPSEYELMARGENGDDSTFEACTNGNNFIFVDASPYARLLGESRMLVCEFQTVTPVQTFRFVQAEEYNSSIIFEDGIIDEEELTAKLRLYASDTSKQGEIDSLNLLNSTEYIYYDKFLATELVSKNEITLSWAKQIKVTEILRPEEEKNCLGSTKLYKLGGGSLINTKNSDLFCKVSLPRGEVTGLINLNSENVCEFEVSSLEGVSSGTLTEDEKFDVSFFQALGDEYVEISSIEVTVPPFTPQVQCSQVTTQSFRVCDPKGVTVHFSGTSIEYLKAHISVEDENLICLINGEQTSAAAFSSIGFSCVLTDFSSGSNIFSLELAYKTVNGEFISLTAEEVITVMFTPDDCLDANLILRKGTDAETVVSSEYLSSTDVCWRQTGTFVQFFGKVVSASLEDKKTLYCIVDEKDSVEAEVFNDTALCELKHDFAGSADYNVTLRSSQEAFASRVFTINTSIENNCLSLNLQLLVESCYSSAQLILEGESMDYIQQDSLNWNLFTSKSAHLREINTEKHSVVLIPRLDFELSFVEVSLDETVFSFEVDNDMFTSMVAFSVDENCVSIAEEKSSDCLGDNSLVEFSVNEDLSSSFLLDVSCHWHTADGKELILSPEQLDTGNTICITPEWNPYDKEKNALVTSLSIVFLSSGMALTERLSFVLGNSNMLCGEVALPQLEKSQCKEREQNYIISLDFLPDYLKSVGTSDAFFNCRLETLPSEEVGELIFYSEAKNIQNNDVSCQFDTAQFYTTAGTASLSLEYGIDSGDAHTLFETSLVEGLFSESCIFTELSVEEVDCVPLDDDNNDTRLSMVALGDTLSSFFVQKNGSTLTSRISYNNQKFSKTLELENLNVDENIEFTAEKNMESEFFETIRKYHNYSAEGADSEFIELTVTLLNGNQLLSEETVRFSYSLFAVTDCAQDDEPTKQTDIGEYEEDSGSSSASWQRALLLLPLLFILVLFLIRRRRKNQKVVKRNNYSFSSTTSVDELVDVVIEQSIDASSVDPRFRVGDSVILKSKSKPGCPWLVAAVLPKKAALSVYYEIQSIENERISLEVEENELDAFHLYRGDIVQLRDEENDGLWHTVSIIEANPETQVCDVKLETTRINEVPYCCIRKPQWPKKTQVELNDAILAYVAKSSSFSDQKIEMSLSKLYEKENMRHADDEANSELQCLMKSSVDMIWLPGKIKADNKRGSYLVSFPQLDRHDEYVAYSWVRKIIAEPNKKLSLPSSTNNHGNIFPEVKLAMKKKKKSSKKVKFDTEPQKVLSPLIHTNEADVELTFDATKGLGIVLGLTKEKQIVIAEFTTIGENEKGPVERSGKVKVTDMLLEVEGVDLSKGDVSLKRISQIIRHAKNRKGEVTFRFRPQYNSAFSI